MHLSEEFIQKWDHIISEVEKTEIPLECINKVIINMYGGRRKTVNISRLRKDGLATEEIEALITRNLTLLAEQVRDIDFIVDVRAVAGIIQPETDKLLDQLK